MQLIKRIGLDAFKYKDYRKYFSAQFFLISGFHMQQIAISWEIFQQFESSFMVGTLLALFNVGLFFLLPVSGVIADNSDKKRLTKISYLTVCLFTLLFALKAELGIGIILAIVFNNLFYGIAVGFEMPVRLVWLHDIIEDKTHITSAIGMNQLAANSSKICGPLLAGFFSQFVNLEACYYANFIFNVIAVLMILWMKSELKIQKRKKLKRLDVLTDFKEGFRVIKQTEGLSGLILLSLGVSFTVFAYGSLMPDFIKTNLNGGADDLGLALAMSGIGAMIASFVAASRKNVKSLQNYIFTSIIIYLFSYFGLYLVQQFWLTYVLAFIMGVAQVLYYSSCQNIIHRVVPKEYLGRVISLFLMGNMGLFTAGSIAVGRFADVYGVVSGFLFSFIGCILALLLYFFVRIKLNTLLTIKTN